MDVFRPIATPLEQPQLQRPATCSDPNGLYCFDANGILCHFRVSWSQVAQGLKPGDPVQMDTFTTEFFVYVDGQQVGEVKIVSVTEQDNSAQPSTDIPEDIKPEMSHDHRGIDDDEDKYFPPDDIDSYRIRDPATRRRCHRLPRSYTPIGRRRHCYRGKPNLTARDRSYKERVLIKKCTEEDFTESNESDDDDANRYFDWDDDWFFSWESDF